MQRRSRVKPQRRLGGPTERVTIIGAGLGGLSAALRLLGAGRSVRIVEAGTQPGGLIGQWRSGGYRFDTGPTVLTMPELIDDALTCVGETRSDWLQLDRLSPSYRARFADGSVLRSYSDVEQMTQEVREVCGPTEAANYHRLVDYLTALFRVEFNTFMDRNLDGFGDLVRPEAATLLRLGGLRSLQRVIDGLIGDERLRRLFTFQSLYAGVAPARARALYGVIAYLDSVSGVWFPQGGMHRVADVLAEVAVKHGARIDYSTRASRIEIRNGRASAVITADGERIASDVVVFNGDLQAAYRDLLPAELAPRRAPGRSPYSPSAFVWHVGSAAALPDPAHHHISFGAAWETTFDEIINRGRLMSDPSLLITNPSYSDASLAPHGRNSYYVLAPCPNTRRGNIDWSRIGPRYQDEIARVLADRGYDTNGAFSSAVEVSRCVTPEDWQQLGLSSGTPFSIAHTVSRTGPLRHRTQHPSVGNLLFCGAGVQPGVGVPSVLISGRLAAARITG